MTEVAYSLSIGTKINDLGWPSMVCFSRLYAFVFEAQHRKKNELFLCRSNTI